MEFLSEIKFKICSLYTYSQYIQKYFLVKDRTYTKSYNDETYDGNFRHCSCLILYYSLHDSYDNILFSNQYSSLYKFAFYIRYPPLPFARFALSRYANLLSYYEYLWQCAIVLISLCKKWRQQTKYIAERNIPVCVCDILLSIKHFMAMYYFMYQFVRHVCSLKYFLRCFIYNSIHSLICRMK